MVELRKRPPPKEPAAPPPAAKKGRASSGKAKADSSSNSVTAKAKQAVTKVKEAVTGPSENENTPMDIDSTATKQPTVEGATEPAPVEKGETGMIPETAGTAPTSVTAPAPGPSTATAEPVKAAEPAAPAASTGATTAPATVSAVAAKGLPTKGRGKNKNTTVTPATGTHGNPNLVGAPADQTQANLDQAKKVDIGATSGGTAHAAPAPAAPAAVGNTGGGAAAAEEANRPPATEDLENPPETGKVELATPSAPAPAVATNTLAASAVHPTAPDAQHQHPTGAGASATVSATASVPLSPASVGKLIPNLAAFGGEVETHAGQKTTLAALLAAGAGKGGVVIFTYPKASTPGCTQQACAFRDNFAAFTEGTGLKIYGLSTDSTKANTTFATKQSLQYDLLCDPAAAMTGALGMKKGPKSTLRGVVVVDGQGVVKVWFQGGPAKTVDVVKEYVASLKH